MQSDASNKRDNVRFKVARMLMFKADGTLFVHFALQLTNAGVLPVCGHVWPCLSISWFGLFDANLS